MRSPEELLPEALLTARLPRQQDDEPPTLRQALIDEVRDYLQTAWEAELEQTPEPSDAWQQVLIRFGDPARLVRQLWLDAMQEQLMSRRLNLAAFAFLALVILGLSALNWRMFSSMEAVAANAEKTNALLLEKLTTLSRPASEDSMTWRKLTVKLKSEDGSPVKGQVSLTGVPFGNQDRGNANQTLNRTIAADGCAEFGLIHVGLYHVTVRLKNGYASTLHDIDLMPGADRELTLTTPASIEREQQVRINFTPPEIQASVEHQGWKPNPESMWLLLSFDCDLKTVEDIPWSFSQPIQTRPQIMVNTQGECFQVSPVKQPKSASHRQGSILTITDWRTHLWSGTLPCRNYQVVRTELLMLVEEDTAKHTAMFQPVPRDSVILPTADTIRPGLDLSKTAPAEPTVNWNPLLTQESADAQLLRNILDYRRESDFEKFF